MFEGVPRVFKPLNEMLAVKDFVNYVLTWLSSAILHGEGLSFNGVRESSILY